VKQLIAALIIIVLAGPVLAQVWDAPNSMGLFFSETDFSTDFTNADPASGEPFDAWIVVRWSSLQFIGGYECSLDMPATVFVLSVGGPNGWTNFGSQTNHLVGYATPVPAHATGHAVLAHLELYYASPGVWADINMLAAEPSSFGGEGPGVVDGVDLDNLQLCRPSGYYCFSENLVATLWGDGIYCDPLATEGLTWSSVKAVFE